MFCINCGTKLANDAAFCTNCGTAVAGNVKNETKKEKVKIVDDTVMLNVKPTFKFLYIFLPYIISNFSILLPLILVVAFVEVGSSMLVGMFMAFCIIYTLYILIKLIFVNKQYKSYNYDFYKTKVIYKDSFINISEKEVKYKNIREVYLRRGLFQRMFNLGTIVLYTNAETGFANGIFIKDVENSEQIYKEIKQLIDEQD